MTWKNTTEQLHKLAAKATSSKINKSKTAVETAKPTWLYKVNTARQRTGWQNVGNFSYAARHRQSLNTETNAFAITLSMNTEHSVKTEVVCCQQQMDEISCNNAGNVVAIL